MIRIYTSKIEKWEEIKRRHNTYIEEELEPKLRFLINILDDIKELSDYVIGLKKVKECLNKITCEKIFKTNNGKIEESDWFKEIKNIKLEPSEIEKGKIEEILNTKINELKKEIEILEKKYKLKQPDYDGFLGEIEKIEGIEYKKIESNVLNQKKQNKKLLDNRTEFIYNFLVKDNFSFKNIFDYDKFSCENNEKTYNWGRHSLLTIMGIEVCPYCQRNYITNYIEDKRNKTTADLDHFYSQKEFPYLVLSLYNFIPSCQICNRTFKLAKSSHKNDILYPYREGFEDFNVKFKLSEKIIDNIMDKKTPFKVKIDYDKSNNRITNTIDTFKLDKVYEESHNNYLKDMIYNVEKYPESYSNKLGDLFEEDKEKMKYHFKEIIKKPYTDRIEKGEPLAKLTKDIMEELGIK